MYNTLCKCKGAEENYLLPYFIILYYDYYSTIFNTEYTALLILVAPPAALPHGATRLNLHSHRGINVYKVCKRWWLTGEKHPDASILGSGREVMGTHVVNLGQNSAVSQSSVLLVLFLS